eukprot:CAMPEP_0171669648 /NCGR_PEP_ID=MMETSP0990-20121206/50164_1 /TAXON_ID=483369 /ORGANISM="non described non described, Strain CCMP2098" /LENGTH=55 /DNA_ID=CAMNT_0012254077 /DNA_START=121 /DNA_END=285 /DNA_ORIENTATION=-
MLETSSMDEDAASAMACHLRRHFTVSLHAPPSTITTMQSSTKDKEPRQRTADKKY